MDLNLRQKIEAADQSQKFLKKRVSIYLTEDMASTLRERADEEGRSFNNYICRLLATSIYGKPLIKDGRHENM